MTTDEGTGDLGRFAEPALLVMVSLASGTKHGYSIMADIASFSGTRIGPGTLYAVLARLEARGLIEPLDEVERRRPYRLTPQGAAALDAQLRVIGRLVQAARVRRPHVAG